LAVTAARIYTGTEISIVTWLRLDEILAGAALALLWHRYPGHRDVSWLVLVALVVLLVASGHPRAGALNFARPYVSALLVGCTLYSSRTAPARLLRHPALAYVAKISYALYVFHLGLSETWLGSGDTIEKYAKRPLYFVVLLLLAHLSTFYFENRWINLGKRWSARRPRPSERPKPAERPEQEQATT
jgi:peptidoglycan/LPS O-acetylase OafA/YrhL